MRPGNRWSLLLLGGSIALMLVLLESATRLIYADLATTSDNTSYFARRWYAANPIRRNHLGFREREFAPTPAGGVYRVAVVGDSLTFGQGVREEDRLTDRLERALNERGEGRFEVLNFGKPGANYPQNEKDLRTALAAAHPDFVLLQWFVNDVEDTDRPRVWPLLPKPLHRVVNPRSALYYLANRVWTNLQSRLGLNTAPWTYYDLYRDPASPRATAARDRLKHMVGVVEAAHVPFALVLWPELDPPLSVGGPLGFLVDQVLGVCREHGWRCVDLRPSLARGTRAEDLRVDAFDGHPNALANTLAARAVLDELGPAWVAGARTEALVAQHAR
jgi:lysophospholipase L1-like esterase